MKTEKITHEQVSVWLKIYAQKIDPEGKYDGPSFKLGILASVLADCLSDSDDRRRIMREVKNAQCEVRPCAGLPALSQEQINVVLHGRAAV